MDSITSFICQIKMVTIQKSSFFVWKFPTLYNRENIRWFNPIMLCLQWGVVQKLSTLYILSL